MKKIAIGLLIFFGFLSLISVLFSGGSERESVNAAAPAAPQPAAQIIEEGAVQAYSKKGYPKMYARYGAAYVDRVNQLMPEVAKKAAASPDCGHVMLVELSDKSQPKGEAIFFVDCKNEARLYISESDLKKEGAISSERNKSKKYSDTDTIRACEDAVKQQLQNPMTFDRAILDTSVYRPNTGGIVVEFKFTAKNNLGGELPFRARCVAKNDGTIEAEIGK